MNAPSSLTGSHLLTYEVIFRHPAAHALAWRDVRALLGDLGHVEGEHNGHLRVTRNGHALSLHAPHDKELADPVQLAELRHFLERSAEPAVAPESAHWLVIINHHEARLFRSVFAGAIPQRILPHSAHVHSRPAKDLPHDREKTDLSVFFGTIVAALAGSAKILVYGAGHGSGSAMTQFTDWSKRHQPALAARIVGTQVVDEHHLTEGQLLATARNFYANVAPSLLR